MTPAEVIGRGLLAGVIVGLLLLPASRNQSHLRARSEFRGASVRQPTTT